jgi:hypothetical protein
MLNLAENGATEHDSDDLEMILAGQGGSVVPDDVTVIHNRPETHD